jgi:hypothetical protein
MTAKPVSKRPIDCTGFEIADFVSFVLAGGEVIKHGLENRVRSAAWLTFLRDASCLVGIAALKAPNTTYRNRVASSAGTDLSCSTYPFELGWVFILPSARSNGYSQLVAKSALEGAEGNGVFATSRADNDHMHRTLFKIGFSITGSSYLSRHGGYDLKLFIRKSLGS